MPDILALGVSADNLLVCHVQHAHLRYIYLHFNAWSSSLFKHSLNTQMMENIQLPSWTTFWRQWRAKWHNIIKFREQSQHSQCSICFKCIQFLHKCNAPLHEKQQVTMEREEHLSLQYLDRLIYYSLRFSSRMRVHGVLVVIIDGMDKSKLAWPQ